MHHKNAAYISRVAAASGKNHNLFLAFFLATLLIIILFSHVQKEPPAQKYFLAFHRVLTIHYQSGTNFTLEIATWHPKADI